MTDEELMEFDKSNLVFDGVNYHRVEELQRVFDVGPIVFRFGAWAVTEYGVECLILSNRKYDRNSASKPWMQGYIIEKVWHIPPEYQEEFKNDAINAVIYSTALMNEDRLKPGQRFRIFRRDKYRCQICGRNASDGVTLEVDHKHPKDKGGSDEDINLWTLCLDCNRGKSNLNL